MVVAASSIIVKTGSNQMSYIRLTDKLWYIHIMNCYSVIKKKSAVKPLG